MHKTLQAVLTLLFFSPPLIFAQTFQNVPARIEAESYVTSHEVDLEATSDEGGGQNVGWIDDADWMDYQLAVPKAGYYTFKCRIANGYSPKATLEIKNTSDVVLASLLIPQTGGMQGWQTRNIIAYLPAGNQTLRFFAPKGGFNFNWFEVAESRTLARRTEAEDFDVAPEVRTEATGDTDGVLNVGWIDDGDWMDYNVKTTWGGIYSFKFRVANSYGNGLLQIKNAMGDVLAQVDIPQTGGWQAYSTVTVDCQLPSGSQVIRLFASRGAFNLNWFEAISHEPARLAAVTLPGKIEAENFDAAHNVTNEETSDEGGGQNAGWIQDGSWMNYRVSVPTAGVYTVGFRIANAYSPEATLVLQDTLGHEYGRFNVPQTGGWQGWKTVNMVATLPSGDLILRVFAEKGGFNFNWFNFASSRPVPARLEAETFDNASRARLEETNDLNGGQAITYIEDTDWFDFNINVASGGLHTISFRISNSYGNGLIQLESNDAVIGSADVPQTGGWQNYLTIHSTFQLPAGSQKLRLRAVRGAFNLNWLDIAAGAVLAPSQITFAELGTRNTGEYSFRLTAQSTNPETPITYTSSNSSVASVSEAGGVWSVSLISPGQATITASQAGSDHYFAAENVSRTLTVVSVNTPPATLGNKIPIDGARWYQLTNASNGLEAMFDGETQTNVHTGWGKVIDRYEAWYPLKNGEQLTLNGIRFFDFTGSTSDNPVLLSIIDENWNRTRIATFTGDSYNSWVGPYPDRGLAGEAQYKFDAPISNARFLVLTMSHTLPTEIEFYGTYQAPPATNPPARAKHIKLRDMLGVNGYEWNFQDGAHTELLVESKVTAAKSFTGLRHYMDWEKLESGEGVFSYNPTLSGSWNYDLIYERCKAEGIEVLACLKTQPNWMQQTYPEDQRDSENVPVRYGKDFTDPLSYIEQAKVAFQYAARYGSNGNVNPSLLSVSTTPRWYGDYPNTVKIGMDLIKYIECDNERDKWWKGRKGYQTAREYAANLSAFYDGHKNTMGAGVGVKNADANMKVVIAGLVTGPDYVKGMVDWCREFRGYKADGSVNLCWDVINFHLYTDDASSSQSGMSTRGAAPEVTNADELLDKFVQVSRELCGDQPVWITEAGYDVHQDSPLKAIPIGSKSALVTQADWMLRYGLFSARHGIEKVFFYQMYDDNGFGGMFGSSGLLNNDQTRRPSADYFLQVSRQFGNYEYKETLSQDPVVDRYESGGQSMYVVAVPDEVGRTATYSLNLGSDALVAKVYTPTTGATSMAISNFPVTNGNVNITASETPVFVVGSDNASAARIAAVEPVTKAYDYKVNVFPNPSHDFFTVDLADYPDGEISLRLLDAGIGRVRRQTRLIKTEQNHQKRIGIQSLVPGSYILEIRQGTDRTFHKVMKSSQ